MFAAWISLWDGSTDTVIKILIQRSHQSLFHARVGFTNLGDGKGIWASTHIDDKPVLGILSNAPIIADHIKYLEEVLSNLGNTLQVSLLPYIPANAAAILPAHVPNEVKSIITESFVYGLVKTAKASHIARYGPMILLFNSQSFKLEFFGQFHMMSPIQRFAVVFTPQLSGIPCGYVDRSNAYHLPRK